MSTLSKHQRTPSIQHRSDGKSPPVDADLSLFEVGRVALVLRIGLGAVFLIGGWWKFSRAIDAAASDALVTRYMAADGYINAFFAQYLFDGMLGAFLSPLGFLTLLSGFELLSGLALIAGFAVRPLSLIWAFLLWSFVVALPVTTSAGATIDARTFLSPAIIVQIRDIGLSGMFFVLLNLGSGALSVDTKLFGRGASAGATDWRFLGLLLRLSLAAVLLVGGFFSGLDHVKSWVSLPWILIIAGAALASGYLTRVAAAVSLAILMWYIGSKLSLDIGLLDNLNAVKREVAFVAASVILLLYGGGTLFRPGQLLRQPMTHLFGQRIEAR